MADDGDDPPIHVQRTFTCTTCGFPTTVEVPALQPDRQATCANCGDWTVMVADPAELRESATALAGALAGETATERQLLAYLLREVLGTDRKRAAELMDSSASNVDNLHQRARQQIEDARRVLEALSTLSRSETDRECDRN